MVPSAAATSAHMATAASRKDVSSSSCRRASSWARKDCADPRRWFHHGSGSDTGRPRHVGQRSSSQRIATAATAGGVNDRSSRLPRDSATSGAPRYVAGMSVPAGMSAENNVVIVRCSAGPVACSTQPTKAGNATDAGTAVAAGGVRASRSLPTSTRRCRAAAAPTPSPGSTVPPGSTWAASAGR